MIKNQQSKEALNNSRTSNKEKLNNIKTNEIGKKK